MICVDASFIVRLLVPDAFSIEARKQWGNWRHAGMQIIAPTLILFEVSATLRRLVYMKKLSPANGDNVFNEFSRFDILVSHDDPLRDRAWQLAKQFNQPRTYDMNYVALAERHNCPFWTADERLYNSVQTQLQWVHWIGASI